MFNSSSSSSSCTTFHLPIIVCSFSFIIFLVIPVFIVEPCFFGEPKWSMVGILFSFLIGTPVTLFLIVTYCRSDAGNKVVLDQVKVSERPSVPTKAISPDCKIPIPLETTLVLQTADIPPPTYVPPPTYNECDVKEAKE